MKIKNLYASNFKSFKEFNLDFKKINIILGPNNSGKSNILKLLLMLKQSFTSILQAPLILNSNIINLGSLKDISYRFTTKNMKIELKLSELYEPFYLFENFYEFDEKPLETTYKVEISYNFDFDKNKVEFNEYYIRNIEMATYLLEYNSKKSILKLNNKPFIDYKDEFFNLYKRLVEILNNFPELRIKSKTGLYRSLDKIARKLRIKLRNNDLKPLVNYFIEFLNTSLKEKSMFDITFEGIFPRLIYDYELYENDNYSSLREFINRLNPRRMPLKYWKRYFTDDFDEILHNYFSPINCSIPFN